MAWQLLSDSPVDNAQLSFYFVQSYWECMANVPAQPCVCVCVCVCVKHWTELQNSHNKEFLWLEKRDKYSFSTWMWDITDIYNHLTPKREAAKKYWWHQLRYSQHCNVVMLSHQIHSVVFLYSTWQLRSLTAFVEQCYCVTEFDLWNSVLQNVP